MRQLLIINILIISIKSFGQYNSTDVDLYFKNKNYDNSIQQSIQEDLFNLNLYEYACALPEVCKLLKDKKINIKSWSNYVDSLVRLSTITNNDSLVPKSAYYSKGLIHMQGKFLLNTIISNKSLKAEYDHELQSLIKPLQAFSDNTKAFPYDKTVRFSETFGETNFWLFVQVGGCRVIGEILERKGNAELIRTMSSNLQITSTNKTPYSLTKRKLVDVQSRLFSNDSKFCKEVSQLMNKRVIAIEDKNKNFFLEHENWLLKKDF